MDHREFLEIVADAARADRATAERAARAVLETLAERIDRGEAQDLAALLPPEEAAWLATTSPAQGFDADEFVRRVAEREDVDPDSAERHVRAVFAAVERAAGREELQDVLAQLSRDYEPYVLGGPPLDSGAAAAFLERVAERAGVDGETAARATAAVLETLAERIAGGEVKDLVERLPRQLHAPLEHGRAHSGGQPWPMSLDEFLERVARRDGGSVLDARDHARAVLLTLRETVGDDEFFDVKVQLPAEYAPVLV